MPYTLAHPGFSLWLKKRIPLLSLQGLVLGSITPDLDLIFRFTNSRDHVFTYDLPGVLLLILPLTLLISIFYTLFARDTYSGTNDSAILSPAPLRWQADRWRQIFRSIPTEALSILAGIGLHLALDYLSHWNAGIITYMFYFLTGFGNIIGYTLYYAAWYLPQIVLSIAGFYLLYLAYRKRHPTGNLAATLAASIRSNRSFYAIFLALAAAYILFRFGFAGMEWAFALHYLIIYATGALIFAALTTPLFYAVWLKLIKFTR